MEGLRAQMCALLLAARPVCASGFSPRAGGLRGLISGHTCKRTASRLLFHSLLGQKHVGDLK